MRTVAYYLPQYHPDDDNDRWWGRGFTEWSRVVRARPKFAGHHQPQLPADLGLYDLRLPEAREAQAEMARTYGIDAFCYFHYWHHGRRLLPTVIDEILRSGRPDFPFCLSWANHDWTRRWDGRTGEMLSAQTYSPEDDVAHYRWLSRVFRDPRYLRVRGRPILLVHSASELPDAAATTATWRALAEADGEPEPYLVRVEHLPGDLGVDCRPLGFDAAGEFHPNWGFPGPSVNHDPVTGRVRFSPGDTVWNYDQIVDWALDAALPDYPRYRCVMPRWDNTARRAENATLIVGATPDRYRRWLHETVRRFEPFGDEEDLLFINAWNEWGEGNHLEPDDKWGHGYLEAHLALPVPDGANDVG